MADALFDLETHPPQPRPTSDGRRRERQTECMSHGLHPLSAALTWIGRPAVRLHTDAAPAADQTADGLRCGTCIHRQTPAREVAGRYPKCAFGGSSWPRATAGPGTDVRKWWPACTEHQEREP